MRGLVLLAVAVWGWAGSACAEMLSVVQITDMQGQVGYEVKSREELASLLKEIKEEETIFKAVAAECKKDWDANKENKLPFQGNRVKTRSAKKVGADFPDRDKADKKRAQLEERASNNQIEEMEKASKKNKNAKPKEEDLAKEEARNKAFADAYAMISKKMGEKLGRPIPGFGFVTADEGKKDEKKPEKKEEKKEEKKDEKKDEKKPAH